MNILDYDLPQERIASSPLERRVDSKLLLYQSGKISDHSFSQLPEFLTSSHNLILNETKVVNARLKFTKSTGAAIEIFCLEPSEGDITEQLASSPEVNWNCMIGNSKRWKEGKLSMTTSYEDTPLELNAERLGPQQVRFSWYNEALSFAEILEIFGEVPLPPYMNRSSQPEDKLRYQTVFAHNEGSVAAPTASLHFSSELLSELKEKGINQAMVNLHVGAGTFKPISTSVSEHEMHQEMFEVSKEELEKLASLDHLIAVGTTSVRTVESLFILANSLKVADHIDLSTPQRVGQWEWKTQTSYFASHKEAFAFLASELDTAKLGTISGYTSLMIVPGFTFNVISGLITNFHMPKSTLLLLVSAFIGDDWKHVYNHALINNYRFLSYGDSSLLLP